MSSCPVPLCQWSYIVQLIFTIFVPIMGRRGAAGNPDTVLGVAAAVFTTLTLLPALPVLVTCRRQTLARGVIIFIIIIIIII